MSALHNIEQLKARLKDQVLVCDSVAAVEAAQERLGERAAITTWAGGKDGVEHADWSPLSKLTVGLLTHPKLTGRLTAVLRPIVGAIKVIDRPADADDDWTLASAPDGFDLKANAKLIYLAPKPAVKDDAGGPEPVAVAEAAPAVPTVAPQPEAIAVSPAPEPDIQPASASASLPAAAARHIGARTNDTDFAGLMEPVARHLLGEPNAQPSPTELRYGTNGSLKVNLEIGVWHDKDSGEGGGVLALIMRKCGMTKESEAADWLREKGFAARPPAPTPARKPDDAAHKLAAFRGHFANGDAAQSDREYIIRKQGKPDGLRVVSWPLRGWGAFKGRSLLGWLMVPVYSGVGNTGELMSIQFIGPNKGEKLNAPLPIKGGSFTVGELKQGEKVYIVEGIGHAWSVNAVDGGPAAVSFGASNIEATAAAVQAAGGNPVIVPDRGQEVAAARIAARLGCSYAPLPQDLPKGADVNDLHLQRGDDAVRAVIGAAATVQEWRAAQRPAPGSAVAADVEDVHGLEEVNQMSWPNLEMKSMKPLNTIPNLRHLLRVYRFTVRYDVIRKELMVTHPGQRGTRDNVKSKAIDTVISLCALNLLPKTDAPSFLLSIGDDNMHNPVTDFITSKPWDGVSRFNDLMATVQTKPEFDRDLLALLLRRWLVSAVAAATKPKGFWSKGVLVFQGDQSLGKTTWFRALLPPAMRDLVKVDASIDPANKDTIISAISHWLVELGELDGTLRKADIARLKGFISQDVDQFRRPYGRAEEKFQRRTVFFASVNPEHFLADDTGNVRWWTVPVTGIDYKHAIDMQQLWAEVFKWFEAGERWWLDPKEEARLESTNADHQQRDPVDEMIASKYDWSKPHLRAMTATQVLVELGYISPSRKLLNESGKVMRKRFGAPTKNNSRMVYKVPPLLLLG